MVQTWDGWQSNHRILELWRLVEAIENDMSLSSSQAQNTLQKLTF